MIKQNYWFSLKSHIYVEFMDNRILIYDTQKGTHVIIINYEVVGLIKAMYEPENLGVVILYSELLNNNDVDLIINNLVKLQIADIECIIDKIQKPIKLVPILNLQNDIDKINELVKDDNERIFLLERDTLKYLFEVNIFLNNTCDVNCKFCFSYVKQIDCCTIKSEKLDELSIDIIKDVLRQIKYSSVYLINIMGGDIYKYSKLDQLRRLILSMPGKVHFYTHYKNYIKDSVVDVFFIDLIVDFPVDEAVMYDILCDVKDGCKIHFIVQNESEYEKAELIIEKFDLAKVEIHPFYNGNNLSFFEENIFMEENDIFSRSQQMREIFRNKKVNKNFFGKLYIFPDGEVKANMNTLSLGNIKNYDILNLINKELIYNTAWRRIRNEYPCDKCLNKFICPPISNYEIVLNKLNLCQVNK